MLAASRHQQRHVLQMEDQNAAVEDENVKLKKRLAEAMLDNAMLKDIAARNGDASRQAGARY
jgi:hypothetical protein